jgi:hypothetical protein
MNQRYVSQLYRDILGREPDGVGLSYFTTILDRNLVSHFQVALAIEASDEARRRQVTDSYMKLLGRSPDAIGLGLSVHFLEVGGSLIRLRAVIAGSPEFYQNRGGNTNQGFVNALYQFVLGRPSDPNGLAAATAALDNKFDRVKLAEQFLKSPENQQDTVASLYSTYLKRQPDSTGQAAFLAELQKGTPEEVLVMFMTGSDEYFGKV